jgi:hypothetical protein
MFHVWASNNNQTECTWEIKLVCLLYQLYIKKEEVELHWFLIFILMRWVLKSLAQVFVKNILFEQKKIKLWN